MRLHRLTVSAFGPFADPVDIPFDEVAEPGLFLIHGATGAGKTSLLDAVCFALYADVPGARSGARSLRSDHAPRDAVPRVTLDFTASGRRFRIERSPEFLRPKKRGSGETRSPARVVLHERVGGQWVGRDSRPDDVAAVVREAVGMGLAQFSKVVLLPQGEFAAFLRASAEERRQVLERLFDVLRFTDVEDWLAGRRRELAESVEDQRRQLAADLDRLADLLVDLPGGAGLRVEVDPSRPGAVPDTVAAVAAELSDAVTAAMGASEAALGAEAAARQASAQGGRVAAFQERAMTARAGLRGLEDSAAQHEEAVRTVGLARRALQVAGHLDAVSRALAAERVAEQRQAAAIDQARRLGLRGVDGAPSAMGRLVAELEEHAETIREAGRLRTESTTAQAHRDRLRKRTGTARQESLSQATRRAAAETEAEQCALHAERCQRALGEVPGLRLRVDQGLRLHRLRTDHDAAIEEIAQLRARRTDLREAEQDARQRLLDLREARLAGMAAELADGLVEGEGCPVCGATSHPHPARASSRVASEDLDLAEERWEGAAAALDQAGLALASAEAGQESRRQELEGAGDVEFLARDVTQARSALGAAQRLADEAPSALAALQRARATLSEAEQADDLLRERRAGAEATLAEAERAAAARQAELASLLQAHVARCPCVAGGSEAATDPASADERHRVAVAAARAVVAAAQGLARERELVDLAQDAAREALSTSGFESLEEAAAARLEAPVVAELERLCREHDEARMAFQVTLDDPEVVASEGVPSPDLMGLAAAVRAAQAAHVSARSAQALAERALREVSRLRDRITARCASLLPALRRSALLRELADTVAGTGPNNTRRMRLSSFVLAARLESVARLANERLAVMGEGRYRLQHSDELAAKGARSGLGLEVLDLWTGQARATSTLSGGEAFMASLALALGLADAVREEAGGFDLQTLFIDEGFGSLDDESLEQVLGVLDGLREGGRAVGVVSHVAELRSRIPSQIMVRKTAHGSSVSVRSGRGAAA